MNPDTIVAHATPPGVAALALIRMSGPDARGIARQLASDLPEGAPAGRYLSWLRDPVRDESLDQALVHVFEGPDSYTGEDSVEFSTHGSELIPAWLVEACVAAGARLAEPGEFTRRAYLNGKMDLVQAESVIDLIESRAPAQHRSAVAHLNRSLSRRLAELREDLLGLEAALVHHLDFPEEDDPPIPVAEVARRGSVIADSLAALLRSAPEGELLRTGAFAVFAGRPNSGKSSLFNALIGRDRAIVTDIAGTTRDAIEAEVSLAGFPFVLVDTAGLRRSRDTVERLGVEVAERYLEEAHLVVFCAEGAPDDELLRVVRERTQAPVVVARTKSDLMSKALRTNGDMALGTAASGVQAPPVSEPPTQIAVSAVTGEGLDELRLEMAANVFKRLSVETRGTVLIRRRQSEGVRRAHSEVVQFVKALQGGVPAEMASTHLRPAESALEELMGVISQDDVLDRVFRDFCVGK